MKKQKEKESSKNTYTFTLILEGVNEPSEELENTLFEAGCNDALLHFRNGNAFLTFDRAAGSYKDAVFSAVKDVESAGNIKILSIEPRDLMSINQIAEYTGLSRQYLNKLLKGGILSTTPPPHPYSNILKRNSLWSFREILEWLAENDKLIDGDIVEKARVNFDINNSLTLRKYPDIIRTKRELENYIQ